jgi:cysteine desulfurase
MKELFLDANAHIPINPLALKAYSDFSNSTAGYGNPSSPSSPGIASSAALELARTRISELIGAAPGSALIFVHNATYAAEWAMQIFRVRETGMVEISPTEHTAVYSAYEKHFGVEFYFKTSKYGVFQESQADRVICIHLQNEIGIIQPIQNIKTKCLFSDMTQSLGKIPVNVSELNVDIAIFSAHKFGGPGSVGFIYLKDASWWKEFGTGSRYKIDRPGTPDVAGIIATQAALENAIITLPERTNNMIEFRSTLESGLKDLGLEILAENENRCPNTTFVRINGKATEILCKLSSEGIYVGLGSACGALHTGTTKLMKRLGIRGTNDDFIRISQWGEYNKSDAEYVLKKLRDI